MIAVAAGLVTEGKEARDDRGILNRPGLGAWDGSGDSHSWADYLGVESLSEKEARDDTTRATVGLGTERGGKGHDSQEARATAERCNELVRLRRDEGWLWEAVRGKLSAPQHHSNQIPLVTGGHKPLLQCAGTSSDRQEGEDVNDLARAADRWPGRAAAVNITCPAQENRGPGSSPTHTGSGVAREHALEKPRNADLLGYRRMVERPKPLGKGRLQEAVRVSGGESCYADLLCIGDIWQVLVPELPWLADGVAYRRGVGAQQGERDTALLQDMFVPPMARSEPTAVVGVGAREALAGDKGAIEEAVRIEGSFTVTHYGESYNGQPLGCGGGHGSRDAYYHSDDPTILAVGPSRYAEWPCGTRIRLCSRTQSESDLREEPLSETVSLRLQGVRCIVVVRVDSCPGCGPFLLDLSESANGALCATERYPYPHTCGPITVEVIE
mgnify:CR=1 FL=1